MYDEKRRRRRYREKKPVSSEAVLAVTLGAAAIAVFFIFLLISVQTGGNTSNLLGGLSIFAWIAAVISLVVGIRARSNENFDRWMRILGVLIPAAAVIIWAGLYFVGMFLG